MTKIGISSAGQSLDSLVDPRFGRCTYFVIVDIDTMESRAVPNAATNASGGAGIQAAQIVTSQGVDTVVTGSVGPNAMTALKAAGVAVLSSSAGTVRQAVESFKQGRLSQIETPSPAYAGMGMGRGRMGARGRGWRR
jgi:predicted Fe-Mo cluster-binding NifX family protein